MKTWNEQELVKETYIDDEDCESLVIRYYSDSNSPVIVECDGCKAKYKEALMTKELVGDDEETYLLSNIEIDFLQSEYNYVDDYWDAMRVISEAENEISNLMIEKDLTTKQAQEEMDQDQLEEAQEKAEWLEVNYNIEEPDFL